MFPCVSPCDRYANGGISVADNGEREGAGSTQHVTLAGRISFINLLYMLVPFPIYTRQLVIDHPIIGLGV